MLCTDVCLLKNKLIIPLNGFNIDRVKVQNYIKVSFRLIVLHMYDLIKTFLQTKQKNR